MILVAKPRESGECQKAQAGYPDRRPLATLVRDPQTKAVEAGCSGAWPSACGEWTSSFAGKPAAQPSG